MVCGPSGAAATVPGVHDDHDDHDGHGDHDDHGDHPAESARWVLVPLGAGLVIGLIVAVLLGLDAGAPFIHTL